MTPDRQARVSLAVGLVLAALLAGVMVRFELAGRLFEVSWVDLAALLLGTVGAAVAWRRRRLHLDLALIGYAAFLAVAGVQALVRDPPLEILGGSSRFLTAALVLFGLGQLTPAPDDRSGDATAPRGWLLPLLGFGVVLGAWAVVELLRALADPHLVSFYAVKNAVVTPLGASNTLAGYLLVPAVAGVAVAARDRRYLLAGVVAAAGIVATLSRGALAALVVVLVAGAVTGRLPRLAAGALAVAAVGGTFLLYSAIGPGSTPPPPPAPAATEAPLLDPVGVDVVPPAARHVTPSAVGRVALWRASADAFADRPLLGVGLNRLASEVTAELRQPHDHAHNAFLQALAESGLLGTAAYLSLWGALVWRLRAAAPSPERAAVALGALALALHAQVEALTYQRGIEVLLAVLLAGAAALPGSGAVRRWGHG